MIEMDITQGEFARQAALSTVAMSARTNSKQPFCTDELQAIEQMLRIPPEEYHLYFFDFG